MQPPSSRGRQAVGEGMGREHANLKGLSLSSAGLLQAA